ncbi:MAG TPA: SusC/RagA family TonB-linked outer membrane protein [Gemmatimonadales bacterium]|nr:SusC/RagA family TonB-linked outer membrane protein [Gemmatimonadales bacterium]
MTRLRFIVGALPAVLWITPLHAQQTTATIRGRVTDAASQQPLAGATVTIGARRAQSLGDGRYLITGVPAGADSIRARLIGYGRAAQQVTVAGGDTLVVDFALNAQAVSLSEVVVTGYGTQRAGNITGAVSQVGSESFNTGVITSPQQLIENKVAGVQVVNNNEPGGGLAIRVRGAASVNASSDPLYVLDGVPLINGSALTGFNGLGPGSGGGISAGRDPLNFLDPNDIASITVLKDAASAAIYGANASNGVVLITTKAGRPGTTHVEYTGSASAASVTRLPSMLNAAQFRSAVQQYAPQNDSLLLNTNTNWFDLVDRTAMGQQHDVSLYGSGTSNNYRLSLGYSNQDGILKGSTAQRISLGVNYDQRLFGDRLGLKASVRGARTEDQFTPNGVLYNAAQMGPSQPVYDTTTSTGYYNWPAGNALTAADNPLEVLNLAKDHGTTYRSVGNLQAKYDFSSIQPLRGLRGTVNLGYDVTEVSHVTFYPNDIHFETKNGTNGSYYRTTPSQTNAVLEAYLDYTPQVSLGPGSLNLTGGYSYAHALADFPGISATRLATNVLQDNGVPQTALPATPFDSVEESKIISFFGRADYNISDRYLASVSIRRDGSSRFGPGNQWGNFPAASVGWRISQEPFLSGISAISDLKLRASWGKTGNQAFGNYLQFSTYLGCNPGAQVQFGNQFVCPFRPSAVDPNIKWESTRTWDVGLDYGFSGQRFTGSIDWYNKHTDDLIFTVPTPAGSNLSNFVTTNIGSMKNTGFEFSLSARVLDGGPSGISLTTDFNAAHNTNELLTINPRAVGASEILVGGVSGGVGSTIQVLEPGAPINSFFVCQQVYQNGKPVEGSYYNAAGQVVTACAPGTNTRVFHDPAPKWMLGLTSSLNYHRFDLRFTLRAWLGNYVFNNIASNLGDYQELTRSAPYNLSTSVLQSGFRTPQYYSDYYVENGSFLRMDNVTVGYAFPWDRQQLRLFVSVQNAFTITGYSGVDPTAGLNGIDNNIYPRSRIVTSGLSVQF